MREGNDEAAMHPAEALGRQLFLQLPQAHQHQETPGGGNDPGIVFQRLHITDLPGVHPDEFAVATDKEVLGHTALKSN